MSRYGVIRAVVIQSGRIKKRSVIYTNAKDKEIDDEKIIKLLCRRWGEENLIKELLLKHLINYYDKQKELLPALAMIVGRGGHVKLKAGQLKVKLRRFINSEIDNAARHICEDLNRMNPVTLDKHRLPIRYEVTQGTHRTFLKKSAERGRLLKPLRLDNTQAKPCGAP